MLSGGDTGVPGPESQVMLPAKSVPPVSGWLHGTATPSTVAPQATGTSAAPAAAGGSDQKVIVTPVTELEIRMASLRLFVPGSWMPKVQIVPEPPTLLKLLTLLNKGNPGGAVIENMHSGSADDGAHDEPDKPANRPVPDTLVVSPTSVNVIESALAD